MARKPEGKGTDISAALNNLMRVLHKRAVVFLISDFIDDGDFANLLLVANKRHDVIAARILDPFELKMPKTANLAIEDAETGEFSVFPGRNQAFLRRYSRAAEEMHGKSEEIFKRAKVDLIDFRCGEDIVKPLVKFFRKRQSKN
jgi:uncharacterized protein (DUF58 family)